MKTFSAKPADIQREWHVIDASGVVLGRLASQVAMILRGKHKPTFTPHMNCGDHVIVINADKIRIKGKKIEDKRYYRHTGYPGGIKETSPAKLLAGQKSNRIVEKAIERMLPKDSPLARDQYGMLRVYTGAEHPHAAQNPKEFDFGSKNPKNKR